MGCISLKKGEAMTFENPIYVSGLLHGAALLLVLGVIRSWWHQREPRAYRIPRARQLRAQRLALKSTVLMRRSAS